MNTKERMAEDPKEVFLIRSSRNSRNYNVLCSGNLVRLECSCEKECTNYN